MTTQPSTLHSRSRSPLTLSLSLSLFLALPLCLFLCLSLSLSLTLALTLTLTLSHTLSICCCCCCHCFFFRSACLSIPSLEPNSVAFCSATQTPHATPSQKLKAESQAEDDGARLDDSLVGFEWKGAHRAAHGLRVQGHWKRTTEAHDHAVQQQAQPHRL